jgi:2C-methyl-D-erythritol 2,4-cyclodiphosphate synthase
MDVKIHIKMITFKEFVEDEITEKDIDALIESLEWEDVIELFDTEDMILEDISSSQRLKMSTKTRSRKHLLALARNVKLKRSAALPVLQQRSVTGARKLLLRKFLKGRDKNQMSAGEKNRIEARVTAALATMKNLPTKLLPKVRQLERSRLANKGK